jgi:hypothetical protein
MVEEEPTTVLQFAAINTHSHLHPSIALPRLTTLHTQHLLLALGLDEQHWEYNRDRAELA